MPRLPRHHGQRHDQPEGHRRCPQLLALRRGQDRLHHRVRSRSARPHSGKWNLDRRRLTGIGTVGGVVDRDSGRRVGDGDHHRAVYYVSGHPITVSSTTIIKAIAISPAYPICPAGAAKYIFAP